MSSYYNDFGNGGPERSRQPSRSVRPSPSEYEMYGFTAKPGDRAKYTNRSNRPTRPVRNSNQGGGAPRSRSKISGKYNLALLMPILLIYYEAVFTILTNSDATFMQRFMPILFCISLGALAFIICTITPFPKVNKIITAVLLAGNAVAFCVAYFIFRMFRIHYNLKTIFSGASDAAGGFGGDIAHMIFSVSGILAILFLFLPFILYVIFGRKIDLAVIRSREMRFKVRVGAAAVCIVFFLIARLIVICVPSLKAVYSTEYNYQSAVTNFGLFTGIRLDALDAMGFGNKEDSFEDDPNVTVPTVPTQTNVEPDTSREPDATPTPTPRVFGPSVMNIDFAKLAENASGKLKELDNYVANQTPSMENEYTGLFAGKNLIFLTAEAFSRELVTEELTPTLYRLMHKGIYFSDFYQPASAGTTGGEYENIFAMLPMAGGASFKKTADHNNYMTIGNILNRQGYNGWAFHNNDYKYYKRNTTHVNLGYSNGFMGYGNGIEQFVKKQWPESDDEMIRGTLPMYIDKQPFNVYYMTVSGHGIYPKGSNAMVRKHWDRVQGLTQYNDLVKGYIACNLDLEDALTYLISELEAKGIADDTVIVMTADHFPYGLDDDAGLGKMPNLSQLYGYDVKNEWQRDHNALILWSGCLEKMDPIEISAPTSSLDIVPTLCNLFDVDWDSRLFPGRDVFSDATPLVFTTTYSWKTDICTYNAGSGDVKPATDSTVIPDGYVDAMKKIVRNKIHYCDLALDTDYFAHVFKNYTPPTPTPKPASDDQGQVNNNTAETQATQATQAQQPNNNPAPSINQQN
ncbi:MAG: sulfatase-like hydrolase/transferase [Clostridiales bacterium]|nr:sulfatase-like hydrolase/transferase [Clostridiales bacterium]